MIRLELLELTQLADLALVVAIHSVVVSTIKAKWTQKSCFEQFSAMRSKAAGITSPCGIRMKATLDLIFLKLAKIKHTLFSSCKNFYLFEFFFAYLEINGFDFRGSMSWCEQRSVVSSFGHVRFV